MFLLIFATILGLHVAEICLWAGFYSLRGALPNFDTSFYFSAASYTTVGYGDVVLKIGVGREVFECCPFVELDILPYSELIIDALSVCLSGRQIVLDGGIRQTARFIRAKEFSPRDVISLPSVRKSN